MKNFRHAPFAFWFIVLIGLVALVVGAVRVHPTTTSDVQAPRVGAAVSADLRGPALTFLEHITGSYRSATAGDFAEWALETVQIARNGQFAYTQGGGSNTDPLGMAWESAVSTSLALSAVDPADAALLIERTAAVQLAAQHLVSVASGLQLPNAAPAAPVSRTTVGGAVG